MPERRPSNSELRLRRLERDEAAAEEERGILELFDEPSCDTDAALVRDGDAEPEQ